MVRLRSARSYRLSPFVFFKAVALALGLSSSAPGRGLISFLV
jgi:hypothetical protein